MLRHCIEILKDCSLEELHKMYSERWSDKNNTYSKKDYIEHFINTYNQIESFINMFPSKKEQFENSCKEINHIVEKHTHFNMMNEIMSLQYDLIQRSGLEPVTWIKRHARNFRVIIQELGVKYVEEIEKLLYGGE